MAGINKVDLPHFNEFCSICLARYPDADYDYLEYHFIGFKFKNEHYHKKKLHTMDNLGYYMEKFLKRMPSPSRWHKSQSMETKVNQAVSSVPKVAPSPLTDFKLNHQEIALMHIYNTKIFWQIFDCAMKSNKLSKNHSVMINPDKKEITWVVDENDEPVETIELERLFKYLKDDKKITNVYWETVKNHIIFYEGKKTVITFKPVYSLVIS